MDERVQLCVSVKVIDHYTMKKYSPFDIREEDIEHISDKAVKLKGRGWIPLSQLAIDVDDEFYITNWFLAKLN